MQHKFLSVFTVILFAVFSVPCYPSDRPALLSQALVNSYGLERAWSSQITMDGRLTTIEHALLDRGTFFLVTGNSDLIALDAETGKTLWSRHIINTGLKPYAPAANRRTVALVCNNEVHVFDRRNGRLLWHELLPAIPTAACQLTDSYLYVPLIDQRMACYPMEELKAPSPGLLALVKEYEKIGYTLDPFSGQVMKADHGIVGSAEFVTSQKGEKKPAPSKRLLDLVPEYAKIGMVLNPYTGEVSEASRPVATWWRENLIHSNAPLKGKHELDDLLEDELTQQRKSQRMERADRLADEVNVSDFDDVNVPYYLKPHKSTPLFCYSFGTASAQPIITYDSADTEILTWFSDRGYLFFAQGSHVKDRSFELQHRISVTPVVFYKNDSKTSRFEGSIARDITFQPVVVQKSLDDDSSPRFLTVVGSESGLVFAYDSKTAETRWWQSIGLPIANRPTAVKDKIYIPCLDGDLWCLDSRQGDVRWRSPGIASFIAASPGTVYAKNAFGDLVAVNPKDGSQKTLFSINAYKDVYHNDENDRIYLISSSGLIQCLRETALREPARHIYLPEDYLAEPEADKERRSLITMPDIPGGVRQQRPTSRNDTPKPQVPPGIALPDVFPFDTENDIFDDGNLFQDSVPTSPATPTLPNNNSNSQTDGFGDDIGFGFEDFGF
ncbi:MAG: PQQ-like beta-propeller repeat protein [Planctomycetaceae bacterium]|nr:PQQ-like beta-propeller repeat protein [Planctomycetaceae bacterium]